MNENYGEDILSIRDPQNIFGEVDSDTLSELLKQFFADENDPLRLVNSVAAAYVYDRKESYSTDNLGNDRNRSYGHDGDDILVEVTFRVPTYEKSVRATLEKMASSITISRAEAKAEEARAKVAEAEAAREHLAAELAKAEVRLAEAKRAAK